MYVLSCLTRTTWDVYIRLGIKHFYHCSVVPKTDTNFMTVVKKHLLLLLTNLQRAPIPKCLVCFQVKNKIASHPCRYTTEEVRDEVFADPASDFDDESSSNESEEYSPQHSSSEPSESNESSENEDEQSINNENQHAHGRGRGCGHFLHKTIRQEHLK